MNDFLSPFIYHFHSLESSNVVLTSKESLSENDSNQLSFSCSDKLVGNAHFILLSIKANLNVSPT
jgi:hypothetical protein